ncbi:putative myristoylated membrane protein [Acanthamoeba polyphaga mimivirus]|uniref:Myristoylated membrane protein n=1 Tax=Acanthamoeba polyphaga mimivirus Kroon TaxID=3069720 RepID=A0A0G2Y8E3_9VIRU|nr:putative myristoylated membrane protein [Acanthamoeba polyphaga mimivirus]AKI80057.1 putative myristoylated membrane protein [Acanthamoeba polyphaga mimivirus Kroon]
MGASASTNQQIIENKIINEAYNSCPSIGTANVTTLSGIKFEPPANCNPPSAFVIGQTATVDSNCLLTNLQKGAASTASKLSSQSKAGLGISVSTNINEVENSITNISNNSCAGLATNNVVDITDTVIKSCQFRVVQNASSKVSCQINNTQNLISKIAADAAAQAKGGSIFGDLFGGGLGGIIAAIIIIVVIAIIIGLVVYFIKQSSKNKGAEKIIENPETAALLVGGFKSLMGGASDFVDGLKKTNMYKFIVLLIMVLIIVILLKTLDIPNPINNPNDSNRIY